MRSDEEAEGSEIILDRDIPIIDCHHHLFVRPNLTYLFEDYRKDIGGGHNVVASVFVETRAFSRSDGPELMRPLGEVEFANAVAILSASGAYGHARICAAIVGHADMRAGEAVGELLDKALELAPGRFRGVRQMTMDFPTDEPFKVMPSRPDFGILQSAGSPLALRELARRGLSFDASVFHSQLSVITEFASNHPDTQFILNHLGMAMGLGLDAAGSAELFLDWRGKLAELARRPNVFCKIGGLGMPFWGFKYSVERPRYKELAHVWSPWVEAAIEAFGADRCMLESNYPPDRARCDYNDIWNAFKYIVGNYSDAEKAALFHGTAARAYRLELDKTR
jgi:predicted TIM-barrel fold metal-dependent hydrolase